MNRTKFPNLSLAVLGVSLCAAALVGASAAIAASDTAATVSRKFLGPPDLPVYRGWLGFLRFEAENAASRYGPTSPRVNETAQRLDEWTRRILADPQAFAKLCGVQEWAYESPVDGSGQPFKISIPTDYDPARPVPLFVAMHGYSGNHLEHSTGAGERQGSFEVFVLGRARGGWYRGLSMADVLHVIDFVEAHWSIDRRHIHLAGGSMGGGGTFRLASRYPHRFATGRPVCGYLVQEPVGNLLTVPLYATHSDDDWVVSILQARGPLAHLRALGGQAVLDETTGLGHAAWDYAVGNSRGDAWAAVQVLPESRSVRRIDFTALDGGAMRSWWAKVAEWGPEPKPARFRLTAAADNMLFAELNNVARLRLRLDESPFDPARPLRVSVNGAVPITWSAPLPSAITLAADDAGDWRFEDQTPATPWPLHAPGGAIQVYDGSPLLIVHGTQGSDAARAAMRAAAEAASRSPNPAWAVEGGDRGVDGVPHHQMLYGHLPVSADRDVTAADIERCNLVLIGSAAENTLVARMAEKLPVRFADGTIVCSDGETLPGEQAMFGLYHFNPLAPQRRIFWVAAADATAYRAGAVVPALAGNRFLGADLIVANTDTDSLVAARAFDSRWRWVGGRASSALLPPQIRTDEDLSRALAEPLRRATGADFAVTSRLAPLGAQPITSGVTRVADLELFHYSDPLAVMEMTGAELLECERRMNEFVDPSDPAAWARIHPRAREAAIDPTRRYRVAVSAKNAWLIGRTAHMAPRAYEFTDLQVGDALRRFLGR